MKPNEFTRQVMVGTVPVGHGAPCAVQSMLNAPAHDVQANLDQIRRCADAGCEIIRMAIPDRSCLDTFQAVCSESPLPVVADVHFDYRIAIEAAKRGAAKLRINPGNIGSWERTDAVIEAAGEAGIPIRIGVNAGSLDDALKQRQDLTLAQKIAQSAIDYTAHFEERGFHDIVVSAKAHDVPTTIEAYRILAREIPQVPLHIGITEAGTLFQGLVKSAGRPGRAAGRGHWRHHAHLADGRPGAGGARGMDAACGVGPAPPAPGDHQLPHMRPLQGGPDRAGPKEVESRIGHLDKPVKVAVMGCVVNGPGEAADADIGVACGDGVGMLFRNGSIMRKVDRE